MRFGIRMLGMTTILFGVYGTALKDAHPQSAADSRATPLILEKNEGEHRVRRPRETPVPTGPFTIKIDCKNGGSQKMFAGTEEIPVGGIIPRHKHLGQDEILLIQTGSADVWLGTQERDVHAGAIVFSLLILGSVLRTPGVKSSILRSFSPIPVSMNSCAVPRSLRAIHLLRGCRTTNLRIASTKGTWCTKDSIPPCHTEPQSDSPSAFGNSSPLPRHVGRVPEKPQTCRKIRSEGIHSDTTYCARRGSLVRQTAEGDLRSIFDLRHQDPNSSFHSGAED